MSDEKKVGDQVDDAELNELLDSALEDFSKQDSTKLEKDTSETKKSEAAQQDDPLGILGGDIWMNDFMKQAADQFEDLQNLMQNQGDIGASIEKMAQSVASAINETDGDASSKDFQSAITQALKDLSLTTENLQNTSEADLAAMFAQTSLEDKAGNILPYVQGMLQSLLSKEILYPSLKELVDKYPVWLEEKKESLSAEDSQRYTNQLELMKKVCTELEKENESDSDEVKNERFKTILSLMQEMQNYGQPLEELLGEQPPLFQFDSDGNPILPTMPPGVDAPQNCCIM